MLPVYANAVSQDLYISLGAAPDDELGVYEFDHAYFNLPLTDEILTAHQEETEAISAAYDVKNTEVLAAKKAFSDIQTQYPLYRAADEQYAEWKAIIDEASAEKEKRISDAQEVYRNIYNEEVAKFKQVFLNEYQSVMDELGIDTEAREWSVSVDEEQSTLSVTIPYATAEEVAVMKANSTIQNLNVEHFMTERPIEVNPTETEEPTESASEELFGDIDGDGKINATDAAYILEYSAKLGSGEVSVDFRTYSMQNLSALLGDPQEESTVMEFDHAHFELPLTDEILTSYQEISAVILPAREDRDAEVQAAKQAFTAIQTQYPLYRATEEQYAEWKAIHDEASAEESQRISDAWVAYTKIYNEEIAKFHQIFLNEYQGVMDELGIDTEAREWYASVNEELDTLTVTVPYATAEEVAVMKANSTIQNLTLEHVTAERPTASQTEETEEIFGDIDGDGVINAEDAAYVLEYSAKLGAGQISADFRTHMKEIRNVQK